MLGLVLLLLLFFNHIGFIEQISNSVVRHDYWRFVHLIELYYQGNLGWDAMATATNGPFKSIIIPGVFLIDGIFFDLELIGVQYVAALMLFVSSLLIWFFNARHFIGVGGGMAIVLVPAFLLALLTPYQMYLYTHGQASLSLMRISLYLCSFALVDRFLSSNKNSPYLLGAMLMFLFSSIVLYGHSAMPSFFATIVIMASLHLLFSYMNSRTWKKEAIVVVAAISFFFLHYQTMYQKTNMSIDIMILFEEPISVLIFYCKLIGASVLGSLTILLSSKLVAIIGAVCILSMIVVVVIFFHGRIYKITWLPFLFLLYPLLVSAQITVARFQTMTHPEKAMRYLGDTPVWLAGFILLIVLLTPYLRRQQAERFSYLLIRFGLNASAILIVLVIAINVRDQWQRVPNLQRNFERYEQSVLAYANDRDSIDSVEENKRIKGFVQSSIDILIDRRLNLFSDNWRENSMPSVLELKENNGQE